jgi:uncharacterized protein (TIGR02117 family)
MATAALAVCALAACASPAPVLPPGPLDVPIDVVQRDWHTEICASPADLDGKLATLTAEFPGARLLCFGFGERDYMMEGDRGAAVMLASLAPSAAVLLVIPLWVPTAQAFHSVDPEAVVVKLRISRPGARNLADFIWHSVQTGADGAPVHLRGGINPGSTFYAASGTYSALATCNTWSASGLRAAGLPVNDAVIFAGDVMDQIHRVAAAQAATP